MTTATALRITFRRDAMLAAWKAVAGVVPSRSPKAVLINVKLIAADDGVSLVATDLEIGVTCRVVGVSVDSPGSALLPVARVASILSTSRDDTLTLSIDDGQVVIEGPRSKFELPSEDPDLFPDVPTPGDDATAIALSAADLSRLIRRTAFACDPSSTRYAMGGCLVELDGDGLAFVATDGRRLAKQAVPAQHDSAVLYEKTILPVKALNLALRAIGDDDEGIVRLWSGKQAAFLAADGISIYTRLVEGRFPDYAAVFPSQPTARIPLVVGDLRAAVEQAAIVTSDESRGVDFRFADGLLTLSTRAADVGKSHVEMPIAHAGEPIEITFDPRYLADALKTLDADAVIAAELIGPKDAAVFVTEDGYKYVVMPLTSQR